MPYTAGLKFPLTIINGEQITFTYKNAHTYTLNCLDDLTFATEKDFLDWFYSSPDRWVPADRTDDIGALLQ